MKDRSKNRDWPWYGLHRLDRDPKAISGKMPFPERGKLVRYSAVLPMSSKWRTFFFESSFLFSSILKISIVWEVRASAKLRWSWAVLLIDFISSSYALSKVLKYEYLVSRLPNRRSQVLTSALTYYYPKTWLVHCQIRRLIRPWLSSQMPCEPKPAILRRTRALM